MKKRTKGGGPGSKVEERLLCRSLLPQPQPGHAVRGESPKHAKSRESVPEYCRVTRPWQSWEPSPPAGLATDGESRSGPPRQSRCLLSNLAAQSAWTAGRSTMHRAVWTHSEGRVTATSVWLAVPVSERRSNTAPRKTQGGCERKRALYAVLVVDHFRELERIFTMAILFPTRIESHSLGQKDSRAVAVNLC